jgi:hypothetical protein
MRAGSSADPQRKVALGIPVKIAKKALIIIMQEEQHGMDNSLNSSIRRCSRRNGWSDDRQQLLLQLTRGDNDLRLFVVVVRAVFVQQLHVELQRRNLK